MIKKLFLLKILIFQIIFISSQKNQIKWVKEDYTKYNHNTFEKVDQIYDTINPENVNYTEDSPKVLAPLQNELLLTPTNSELQKWVAAAWDLLISQKWQSTSQWRSSRSAISIVGNSTYFDLVGRARTGSRLLHSLLQPLHSLIGARCTQRCPTSLMQLLSALQITCMHPLRWKRSIEASTCIVRSLSHKVHMKIGDWRKSPLQRKI